MDDTLLTYFYTSHPAIPATEPHNTICSIASPQEVKCTLASCKPITSTYDFLLQILSIVSVHNTVGKHKAERYFGSIHLHKATRNGMGPWKTCGEMAQKSHTDRTITAGGKRDAGDFLLVFASRRSRPTPFRPCLTRNPSRSTTASPYIHHVEHVQKKEGKRIQPRCLRGKDNRTIFPLVLITKRGK